MLLLRAATQYLGPKEITTFHFLYRLNKQDTKSSIVSLEVHGSHKEYLRDRQREQGNTNDVKGVQLINNLYHLDQTQADLLMPGKW